MIKAIETVYNNYTFRSRLEARWAVFFDALQIKYEYEREGFDIDGLWYLPDFYLPDYSCWIEIKPKPFVFGSDPKVNAFAKATEDTFLLIRGIPKADNYNHGFSEDERYTIQILSYYGICSDTEHSFFYTSDKDRLNTDGWVFCLARKSIKPELWLTNKEDDGCVSILDQEAGTDIVLFPGTLKYPTKHGLEVAYGAAMQARFEFSENKGDYNG